MNILTDKYKNSLIYRYSHEFDYLPSKNRCLDATGVHNRHMGNNQKRPFRKQNN
jgi:hypothetical protein